MKCKTHPDAPHGFDRNGSHSEDRYVCMCEHWEPPEPRALVLAELLEQNALMPLDDVAAAELRRLHDENEALKAAQYECGFGAGCCYQAAKSEADEVLLRQALDTLAYWLEHGETPGSHDMIQRTHDALQERLK